MRVGYESGGGRSRVRYFFALVLAVTVALGVAVPVFAAEEPAGEDEELIQPQVVGGEPVPNGKYKFIATLRNVNYGNTAYRQHFCGGTLIDRNSVLTAAHCVDGVTKSQLRVTVGRTVLDSSQGRTRKVVAIYRHPKYNGLLSNAYDAAVLKLSRKVKNIAPARIPNPDYNALETPGRRATIAGWGNTEKQDPNYSQPDNYPKRMQEARVPIVTDEDATRAYGSDYVPRLMLAAGEEGKDTCQGDSGGPIFVKKRTGRVLQLGITSFGTGCGARGYPGVYAETNAKPIRSFIYNAAGK